MWYKMLLSDLGVCVTDRIPLYQDNKSTIIMAVQGGSFQRTKHLIGRQSYIKERIEAGDIVLKHKSTKEMEADLLTKPLSRATLLKLKDLLYIKNLTLMSKVSTGKK